MFPKTGAIGLSSTIFLGWADHLAAALTGHSSLQNQLQFRKSVDALWRVLTTDEGRNDSKVVFCFRELVLYSKLYSSWVKFWLNYFQRMVGIKESSWHRRTSCFEIASASFNPIWWFMLLFCFRLKIDSYLQNLSCAPNFLSSWAVSGWPQTVYLFPMDAQLLVGMILLKNFLLWIFKCKF